MYEIRVNTLDNLCSTLDYLMVKSLLMSSLLIKKTENKLNILHIANDYISLVMQLP